MITRREALKTTLLAAAACAARPAIAAASVPAIPFTLPPLPYAVDALEPHIDARTMEIHHDKHHAAYVSNLNKAVAQDPALAKQSVEELLQNLGTVPQPLRTAIQNNGGGHFNHTLFWQMMSKGGGGEPKGELAQAIEKSFGSVSGFKDQFTQAAMRVFGSGWAWLVMDGKNLKITSSANQDLPALVSGQRAAAASILLGLDVWEHAYYLKYQNRRADYVGAWWNVVNWDFVSNRMAQAQG
jgi:Fe-Mn family superoxide dismutase